MKITCHVLAASLVACGSLAHAGGLELGELGRDVPGFDLYGSGGLVVADFDGDGFEDIVVPGTGVLQVFGRENGALVVKQALFVPWLFERLLLTPPPGAPNLVGVGFDGTVRQYSGWPLAETHSINLGEAPLRGAAVGDIDADGDLELVTSPFFDGLRAHDLATGALAWQLAQVDANEILLAQMDGDPALEIIVTAYEQGGLVLDGATQAVDWSYKDGFGYHFASGHFQPGGGAQFVGADGNVFALFQSAPWSPLWDEVGFNVYSLAAADIEGDGIDELLVGEVGSAIVFDTQSRSVRLDVSGQAGAIGSITRWKPDGAAGDALIAFSLQQAHGSEHALFRAVDGMDGSTVLERLNDKPGAYSAVALGRLGATAPSLVFGASAAERHAGGAWTQVAMATGAGQWESPPAADIDDAFDMQPRATLILDEGTPTSRLVLAGTSDFRGARLVSLDGATHAIQWTRDHSTIPSLEDRAVADVRDVELDGSRSLVACLDSGQGPRLMMMDAQTGAFQWESVAMGGFEGCRHALAGQFNDGPDPFVVAVLATSLHAFNANTHLPEWVLTTPAAGASLLEHGENGREIVVFHGADLRFHDAASRTLLREFALEDPVTAVTPLGTDIHHLAVATGGRIKIVDGVTGATLASSDYFGTRLAHGNRLAVHDAGGNTFLIGAGSEEGVFRLRVTLGEWIFTNGFEVETD